MKTAREIHKGNKNRLNLPLHKLFGWLVRLHLTEKEIDKIFSRFFAQFLVKLSKGGDVAVQVGFHHVLENVAYFVISALLCDSPAVSFHKALFIKVYNDSVYHLCFSYGIRSTAIGLLVPIG